MPDTARASRGGQSGSSEIIRTGTSSIHKSTESKMVVEHGVVEARVKTDRKKRIHYSKGLSFSSPPPLFCPESWLFSNGLSPPF